ncbi:MAG: FAD-binding protein [Clostridia bacterium]|nr:FAD-binding protein [Clostridia bacterium]
MLTEMLTLGKTTFPLIRCSAVVVGSGAAAFNAALSLCGADADVCLITEGVNMGTSRNTGSDKQTYYKLSTSIHTPDCAGNMAKDLFAGGSMHGDLALTEAIGSLRGFYHLVSLGVPFPHDRYGEYPGYRTDHDAFSRATSCGPLTSRYMTEALERACRNAHLPILDGYRAFSVLTEEGRAAGIACIAADRVTEDNPAGITVILAGAVVWAAGGPSAVYCSSVYPESQNCSLGAPLLAGASAENLTESQYGIASTAFRWNLSGSYQQVLPRYVSVDADGREREFLCDAFTEYELARAVFLKGYEWPFDPDKTREGPAESCSSEVDIAVYREITAGRRVYLDFRREPSVIERRGLSPQSIGETAYTYLEKSGALGETPIRRLRAMNERAYRLYLDHGIDLEKEMLEIAVCAQHLNGGLACTIDYENPALKNFYPVGECAGVFGIKRPGGSALNSTQVSSARAAEAILARKVPAPEQIGDELLEAIRKALCAADLLDENGDDPSVIVRRRLENGRKHDLCAAFLRDREKIGLLLEETAQELRTFSSCRAAGHAALTELLISYDTLVTRYAMLSAIAAYIDDGGLSRGSYRIVGTKGTDEQHRSQVLTTSVRMDENGIAASCSFVPVRPIPDVHNWFETVYNQSEAHP